jgi:hypothetical protein
MGPSYESRVSHKSHWYPFPESEDHGSGAERTGIITGDYSVVVNGKNITGPLILTIRSVTPA